MHSLRYVLLLVGGFAIGWFTHSLTTDEPTERAARRTTETARRDVPLERVLADEAPEDAPGPAATDHGHALAGEETAADPEEAEGEAGETKDPVVEMVQSMSKEWSGWATMMAKQKLPALIEALGLDPETGKDVEEAILAEIERQVELAILMMVGEEEMNGDAFAYFMGMPPDLSEELERQLATFLSDGEIATVRTEVQKGYKKQLNDMAEMEIGKMGISDLSDDQNTRMREIFAGKDYMKEQFTQFAEAMRNRDVLGELMKDPKAFNAIMEQNLAPTRNRVRDILSVEQFKKYQVYEKSKIKQAEMGIRMMQGMLQAQKKKAAEPPAQPDK